MEFRCVLFRSPRVDAYYRHQVQPMIRSLERMVARGEHINVPRLLDRIKDTRRELKAAKARIPVLNPGSTKQLVQWLYEDEGLPIIKRTKGGAPSTDEETVNRLALRYPPVRAVLNYRRPKKNLGTYLLPRVRDLLVSFDGLHHQEVRPTGTKSGRISGAFHTTPRDWKIRSIYDAPPGWVRGGGDYAQIETRLCAWAAAGKPTTLKGAIGMLAAFRDHRDVYVETAAEILGKPEHEVTTDKADPKNERQIMGKVPTLAKEYRISAKGFQEYAWAEHQLELSRGQAAMICKKWDQKWPEFQRWHRLVEAMVRERGWVMSDVGRVRHLPAAKGRGYEAEEAIRQAINSPIQDDAFEITARAHILLDKELDPDKAYVTSNVHDAVYLRMREDDVDEIMQLVTEVMLYAPISLRDLGFYIPSDLVEVETGIGAWGIEEKWETHTPSLTDHINPAMVAIEEGHRNVHRNKPRSDQ